MHRKTVLLILILFSAAVLNSQDNTLKQYIEEALESNIALQQKELSYEQSLAALKEARGMFFPRLSLEARFSVARGGRTFEIPTGDLVNPIYDNLNLINGINSATYPDYPALQEFPHITNEETPFLRRQEHETKLRVYVPVFNTSILYNQKIKQNISEAEKVSVDIYKRELVKEVKTAYFNYLKTGRAVTLFNNTLELVKENLRTTESLYKNHKLTIDEVYSAKAQVKDVEQQLAEAEKDEKVAKAYFNFLLNRSYDTPVNLPNETALAGAAFSIEAARQTAFSSREELQQFNYYLAASDNNIQLNKGNWLPIVNLVGDYGFQGTHYSFSGKDDFAMGSVVLSWNIFDKTNKAKVQQARIERNKLEARKTESRQQIGLQVVSAFYELEAALKLISLGGAEVESAKQAFRLVQKKYSQGQANLVAFTNARTQLTNARQKLIIAEYGYQLKLAEFERATGTYRFN